MPVLSIVIPAYNEGAFIGTLLEHILRVPTETIGYTKEIIVVNDGSRDNTEQVALSFASSGVRCFTQVPNQGKGKAVRRGIRESTGDYVLIQDADLEYDPQDYLPLLRALASARPAGVSFQAGIPSRVSDHGWRVFFSLCGRFCSTAAGLRIR
jgi:dolichol-phosphate mannosyltransferase